jgi:hypothetical protein
MTTKWSEAAYCVLHDQLIDRFGSHWTFGHVADDLRPAFDAYIKQFAAVIGEPLDVPLDQVVEIARARRLRDWAEGDDPDPNRAAAAKAGFVDDDRQGGA